MRIDRVLVNNYRGIRVAKIDDLARSPVITISGRNGAGKSLVLEAIAVAWRRHIPEPARLVGPWSDECLVEVAVVFEPDEWVALFSRSSPSAETEPPTEVILGFRIRNGTSVDWVETHPWSDYLREANFQSAHPFAQIDLLPANRTLPKSEKPTINLDLLGEQQTRNFRQTVIDSISRTRQQVQLVGVQPFLASMDYRAMLAGREGTQPDEDLTIIAENFQLATGKVIQMPKLSASGVSIMVTTPSGVEHGVDDLSSGEQEALGMMYYVRRLSARGGILLIDEPEVHLHPTLQRAVLSIVETVAQRAQVWMTTHSPKLVAEAPLDAVLHMIPASPTTSNQFIRVSKEAERSQLFDDLGMHPIDLLQNDLLLVVEGRSDEKYLKMLFPRELARAYVHHGNGATGVEHAASVVASESMLLPSLCIRDRDMMPDNVVNDLERRYPNLFVWPWRSLENQLLDPYWIAATLKPLNSSVSVEGVRQNLKDIADDLREESIARLIEQELDARHGIRVKGTHDPVTDVRVRSEALVQQAAAKLADFPQVAIDINNRISLEWEAEWLRYVQGKKVLSVFVSKYTPLKTLDAFISAMAYRAMEDPTLLPQAFSALQSRLRDLLNHRNTLST